MKLAIPADGQTLDAAVAERFGRAPFLLLVDSKTLAFRVVVNEVNVQAAQGAGLQTAERTVREEAAVLLTSNCGPKALSLLAAAGIKVYHGAAGTVRGAISAWAGGNLPQMTPASRAGHAPA